MKLNKNSWHYQMVTHNLFGIEEYRVKNDLCGYFWLNFMRVLFIHIPISIAATSVILTFFVLAPLFVVIVAINFGFPLHDGPLITIGVPVWIVYIIGSIIYAGNYLYETNKYKRLIHPSTKVKQPNILVEYVKAKKSKYCPRIDWED